MPQAATTEVKPKSRRVQLLDLRELAARSGLSLYTWRWWAKTGRIASVRLGRRLLVTEQDFEDFVRRNRIPAREQ